MKYTHLTAQMSDNVHNNVGLRTDNILFMITSQLLADCSGEKGHSLSCSFTTSRQINPMRGIEVPSRILRDTALDSDRIAGVDEGSEVLFYRLIMLADDFGRFDGRLPVIRARAFALRQAITEKEIARRLAQLSEQGLIIQYQVDDKPYIEIPRFGQRQRAEKSKFPDKCQSDVGQMPVNSQASAYVVECRSRSRSSNVEGESKALSGKPDLKPLAIEVLNFLNTKVGRNYQPNVENLRIIEARLRSGATVEEMRIVIVRKWREWNGDEKMSKYLRPATLFNATKYAQYQGEIPNEAVS